MTTTTTGTLTIELSPDRDYCQCKRCPCCGKLVDSAKRGIPSTLEPYPSPRPMWDPPWVVPPYGSPFYVTWGTC